MLILLVYFVYVCIYIIYISIYCNIYCYIRTHLQNKKVYMCIYLWKGTENNIKIKTIIWSIDLDIYTIYIIYMLYVIVNRKSKTRWFQHFMFFSYFWLWDDLICYYLCGHSIQFLQESNFFRPRYSNLWVTYSKGALYSTRKLTVRLWVEYF